MKPHFIADKQICGSELRQATRGQKKQQHGDVRNTTLKVYQTGDNKS